MGTMAGSVEEVGAAALELHALQHVGELRATYESGRTRPLAWRQSQLRGLLRLLADKEEEAFRALHHDLGKHRAEAYRDEVGVIIKSANAALREVGKWAAPEKVWVPLVAFPASAHVVPEPLGVVLIFSCWNFPLGIPVPSGSRLQVKAPIRGVGKRERRPYGQNALGTRLTA